MSNVVMNLPGDKSHYPPTDHSILTLYALRDGEHYHSRTEHFVYSLNTNGEPVAQVFRPTGDIMFKKVFFEKDVANITMQAAVDDNSGMIDTTTIQLNIGPKYPLNCDLMLHDLCFWQSATYRIFENRQPTVIGSLNSPYLAEMCKGYKLSYALLDGGNQFDVVTPSDINKSWELRSLKSLDRDVNRSMKVFSTPLSESGEYRYLSVKCAIKNPSGKMQDIMKNITIKILDEDDNLPATGFQGGFVGIQLGNNLLQKGQVIEHKDLMFMDRDSPPVNAYLISISDDKLHVFDPNCSIFEDDRENETHTAIFCKLIVTKDIRLSESPYTITLKINDTTLLPGFGNSVISVPIRVYFERYEEFPKALALTMPPTDLSLPLLLYPHREVTIFRTAAPYARVTQPLKMNLRKGISSFSILNDTSHEAFAITETEGIVYVKNVMKMREAASHVRVTVQWLNNKVTQTDNIVIKISNEPNHTCHDRGPSTRDWNMCAFYRSKKDCNKGCGISTGGAPAVERRKIINNPERCMWRGDPHPGNEQTHLYATCTPDIDTCPNGVCDSLENLSPLICPQDCSAEVVFPLQRNPRTGRGFDVGAGICSCNPSGGCLCDMAEKRQAKPKPLTTRAPERNATIANNSSFSPPIVQSNVSRRTGVDISACGTKCILGITGSAVVLVTIICGMIICFRQYRKRRMVREKFSNDTTDLSVPLSDYVDRSAPTENLNFNFNVTTIMGFTTGAEPDPKWEFPRGQLKIEQTLGEGEFGRVLRAQALSIGGQPGYTTVAVKTLKNDAGERELADLLSEYQLLKEVSHPNIIKLLGASTVPGGPVYLIIEFAEHGSLRNYLRRSRHLHTDLHIQTNPMQNLSLPPEHYDEPKICDITPNEILSFAWQIANGMAYLSDIKLVHRDLAARNILLAAEKVCKISDFGLTRDIYQDDAYFKRSKGRVPIKWMAPESLSDHVYTNKSDVWSFGILIWELVTLGASPYPGIVVQSLFHLLKTGYRMERPENCSVVLYKVMRSCWSLDPEKRPTFSELSMKFEKMLADKVEYLDLTSNAFNNRGYFCDNLEDIEVDVEDSANTVKVNTEAINYLNKTIDYEKCGNATKINVVQPEEEKIKNDALLSTSQPDLQNSLGYETPVKLQNKPDNTLTTPVNEFPQYGYTDMNACKSK
ncbi:proto-oncogene tyrosine-protein kinase receptor Ret [Photinus pyralis]|uniref:proto-oncogene tyrosine-protein kinase receptor Ret n=1 Tax=Photinus pyralis TaxID=7054 RepID=UPI00126716EB|nr:proto-oncogene tyrosine-protein kinase receptor Ret [Photinus pyralis]